MKGIDRLAQVQGGLLRNLTRRALFAQGEPWWKISTSPWKISIEHDYTDKDSTHPDFWMDEALELCENELTHQYFGLTFNDLMKMDPGTFDRIKRRIHDFARRQAEKLSPELKKELGKK